MEFEQRLQRAIQRGEQNRIARDQDQASRQLSSEEQRSLHSRARIDLSDRIETCLRKLADTFPGFRYESILGEQGWGARINRDDLQLQRGGGGNSLYSRLELVVSPLGATPIVELVAKGTIRNREVLQRRHYQQLDQLDLQSFAELIDLWVLEYAERYAAAR